MKRSDIVRSMQVKFKHMRATDAAAILDTVSDHMIESISKGDRIEIRGFNPGHVQPRLAIILAQASLCLYRPVRQFYLNPVVN